MIPTIYPIGGCCEQAPVLFEDTVSDALAESIWRSPLYRIQDSRPSPIFLCIYMYVCLYVSCSSICLSILVFICVFVYLSASVLCLVSLVAHSVGCWSDGHVGLMGTLV